MSATVTRADLLSAIRAVRHAQGSDWYSLHIIWLVTEADQLAVMATDNYRVAQRTITLEGDGPHDLHVGVLVKDLRAIVAWLDRVGRTVVTITADDRMVVITGHDGGTLVVPAQHDTRGLWQKWVAIRDREYHVAGQAQVDPRWLGRTHTDSAVMVLTIADPMDPIILRAEHYIEAIMPVRTGIMSQPRTDARSSASHS